MKVHRLLKVFIPGCLTLICIIVFVSLRSPNDKRTNLCRSAKPLTQITVDRYDLNGVKLREGTFTRKISFENNRELNVVIFPRALSSNTWSKVPQSSIQYLGKGGDGSWKEWLRPDYFYLLRVSPQTTGFAFGRLCYRNGDVEVVSIKKLKQISPSKVIINDKISLSDASTLLTIYPDSIIVNTGSDRRDTLGSQTEVYFTTENLKFD